MTTATRLSIRDVLLLLSEKLESNLVSCAKKPTQQKSKERVEEEISNLRHFLGLNWEQLEEVEVFKPTTQQLGTLGECIDQAGNFWVNWEGDRTSRPEQITNLVPVSRQSIPELKIGQEIETTIDLSKQTGVISFFAGDYVVLQINDDLVPVNISQLVTTEESAKPEKPDHQSPLCPHVLVINDRENYYQPPVVIKAEVLYSTDTTVRVKLGEKEKNLAKEKVYCLFEAQEWEDFQALYRAFEKALIAQARALVELGRYDKRLAEQGGYKKAPNPLTPFVIIALDPDDDDAYYLTHWAVPYANLEKIERHMPVMMKYGNPGVIAAQAKGFCCPTELHFALIEQLLNETKRCQEALVAFIRNLQNYSQLESSPRNEGFFLKELEKSVWEMTVYYLSDVLKTEEEEFEAIVLTCETDFNFHVQTILEYYPIPQREFVEPMARKTFRELYETDAITSRLEQMPVFSVGDKVQAVGECAIAGGIVAEVCNHAIKLQESPTFFLADLFELVASAVTPTPSETPRPIESTEMWLDPKLVILDAGTQSRDPSTWGESEGIVSEEAVKEYAQLMREGLWDYEQKPLPVAYFDGKVHYASDSHHRTAAAIRAGVELIYEIRSGGLFEAIANSCRSNRKHTKLQFTKSDQRRQIELFLDTLDRATPEQRQKLLESVPGLSDREKSWSCRVIAKYLELSEAGYRTVNNIVAERKQKQLAAELRVGQRVQLSTDQRKLTNFKLLASQLGGCAAKIIDIDIENCLASVLPYGLPETSGFCRWVKTDAVSPLAEGIEPFARLIESWQKHLVLDFCASTYKGMTFQYMEGQEVDNTWTAIVRVEQGPVGVVLDYATSFLSIKEIEETATSSGATDASTSTSTPVTSNDATGTSSSASTPATNNGATGTSTSTSTPAVSNGATGTITSASTPVSNNGTTATSSDASSDSSQELSPEDTSLTTTIGNCFELLEFELFGHLDQWLAQSSVSTLERIAQGAEQLTQKVKAALASRNG